jgi:ferredoxin
MPEDVYRLLQQRLDTYSMGFPATESGIELKILRHLFSAEDSGLFLDLTPRLEAPEAAAARIGRPVEQTAARLEDMARRGLLFRLETGGRVSYGTIPFVHGLFEFQVKNLDRGMGRKIDVEEAVSILSKCQEAGLVTQPSTSQNPAGMCNCCGDCCGVLRALNKHPRPAELVFSNHYAVVDRSACSGCEACLERCQMNALKMADDGTAVVDRDRCIGCGLCVTTCPTEALKLAPKSGESRRVPPANTAEQMQRMAQKRGLV